MSANRSTNFNHFIKKIKRIEFKIKNQ
jgi:hypothetical protein